MSGPLVSVRGAGLQLAGTTVLQHVDLDLPPGRQLALTGRSGSGKSSLLLLLAGLVPPSTGTVSWPGLDPDPRVRRSQIGMVFQAPSLMPELTAVQNVELPQRLQGVGRAASSDTALKALGQVHAVDLADALPGQLSGGQQQRVAVARVLAGAHRLVLADEPTGALDRAHAHEVLDALADGVGDIGGTLLVATHDLELAARLAHRLIVADGTVSGQVPAAAA